MCPHAERFETNVSLNRLSLSQFSGLGIPEMMSWKMTVAMCVSNKWSLPTSMSLFTIRSSTDRGSKWGKMYFYSQEANCFIGYANRSGDLRLFRQGPCRRLLTTLIQGLDAHLFGSQHDIYMPNCDKRGFFRKKQARSPNRPTQLQPV